MQNNIISISPLQFPWQTEDPFLFTAHHLDHYPAGNKDFGIDKSYHKGRQVGSDFTLKDGFRLYHGSEVPGFPYHPHRGFETITINKQGLVDHSDSLGAAGRFGAGDVQWMTAGSGVQHSEMFPLVHQDKGNTLEIFQIWLNLPAKSKMVEPHFKMLWQDMIPVHTHADENGKQTVVDLIAGHAFGMTPPDPTPDSWAAESDNDVWVLTFKMEANAHFTLPAANCTGTHRKLYFYRGSAIEIAGQQIKEYHQITLDPDQETTIHNGDAEGYFLLLQGRPIQEPVAQHGPFVMNTQEEIWQTFEDFQRTQFGGWPWPQREQTHGNRGRFALHADGREETK